MPISFLLAGFLMGSIAGGGLSIGGAILVSSILMGALSFGIGALRSLLAGSPPVNMSQYQSTQMVKGTTQPWLIIVGRARVAPVLTWYSLYNNGNAEMVCTYAGHEVDGFEEFLYNDDLLALGSPGTEGGMDVLGVAANPLTGAVATTSRFYNTSNIFPDVGDPANTAQPWPSLVGLLDVYGGNPWLGTSLQRGRAKVRYYLEHLTSNFPNGIPLPRVTVRGVQVYDPRTGLVAWSNNPALICRWWALAPFGMNPLGKVQIDDSTVIAAANICDEVVEVSGAVSTTIASIAVADASKHTWVITPASMANIQQDQQITVGSGANAEVTTVILATATTFTCALQNGYTIAAGGRGTGYPFHTAGEPITAAAVSEPRYTCNGCFFLGQESVQNTMLRLLSSMAGEMVPVGGVYRMYAGAYRAPTADIGPGDFRGEVQVQSLTSVSDTFNSVKGQYISPANDYQASDYPWVQSGTYQAQDGGPIWGNDFNLPFTNSPSMAARIAALYLEENRRMTVVTAPLKLTQLNLTAVDVVTLSLPDCGWVNKIFKVMRSQLTCQMGSGGKKPTWGLDLTLKEYDAASYEYDPTLYLTSMGL